LHDADKTITKKMGEAENKLDKFKSDTVSKLEQTKKETGREIDKFDQVIEKKTVDAKSGISSWFGFGK
jgi:ferritin-like metal-binding protein YciE